MPTNVDDDACQIDSKAGTMLWRLLLIYQQYSQLPAKHPVAKKNVFCFQNCSGLLWENNVLWIFWNTRLVDNLQKKLRSVEQFIQTLKGKNNFGNWMFFKLYLEVFIALKHYIQVIILIIEFELEKKIRFRNSQEKLENIFEHISSIVKLFLFYS